MTRYGRLSYQRGWGGHSGANSETGPCGRFVVLMVSSVVLCKYGFHRPLLCGQEIQSGSSIIGDIEARFHGIKNISGDS